MKTVVAVAVAFGVAFGAASFVNAGTMPFRALGPAFSPAADVVCECPEPTPCPSVSESPEPVEPSPSVQPSPKVSLEPSPSVSETQDVAPSVDPSVEASSPEPELTPDGGGEIPTDSYTESDVEESETRDANIANEQDRSFLEES